MAKLSSGMLLIFYPVAETKSPIYIYIYFNEGYPQCHRKGGVEPDMILVNACEWLAACYDFPQEVDKFAHIIFGSTSQHLIK